MIRYFNSDHLRGQQLLYCCCKCFEHTRSLLTKCVSPHVGDHWLRLQSHVRDLRTHLLTCVYWLNVCCCTMICQMHGRGEKQISVTISSQKVHAEDTSWTHRVTFVKLSQPHYNSGVDKCNLTWHSNSWQYKSNATSVTLSIHMQLI